MPLELLHDRAVVLIRQSAFERVGLPEMSIDERYNLTDEEFRVEDGLIALGPLPSEDMLPDLIDDLEKSGLVYFDDFFELSGNWPDMARALCARSEKSAHLKTLLDDCPLLDERHSVLDSVDHDFRARRNCCRAE